jgi:hypothetical protein
LHGDAVRHDVIRVPITTIGIVCYYHMRAVLANNFSQTRGRFEQVRIDERLWFAGGFPPMHARVVIAKHIHLGKPEYCGSASQFCTPYFGKPLAMGRIETRVELLCLVMGLAKFAVGAGHQNGCMAILGC